MKEQVKRLQGQKEERWEWGKNSVKRMEHEKEYEYQTHTQKLLALHGAR